MHLSCITAAVVSHREVSHGCVAPITLIHLFQWSEMTAGIYRVCSWASVVLFCFVFSHKSEVFSWRQLHNHPHSTWQLLVPLKPLGVECGRCSTVQTSSPKTRRSSVSFHKAAVGRREERTARLRHDCRLVTNSGCWTSLLFMRSLFSFLELLVNLSSVWTVKTDLSFVILCHRGLIDIEGQFSEGCFLCCHFCVFCYSSLIVSPQSCSRIHPRTQCCKLFSKSESTPPQS